MSRRFTIYPYLFCTLLFSVSCAESGSMPGEDTPVPLRPVFVTSDAARSRSIVSETGADGGKVNRIGVCLTKTDGHTAYADPSLVNIYTVFTTTNGSNWTTTHPVNLRDEPARLYAWYPAPETVVLRDIPLEASGTRTVPITLLAEQTFDGASTTACSQEDYLYGAATAAVGSEGAITVHSGASNPTIYLQHALTQLVFTIEYKAGRVPDATYDYVKSISLTTSGRNNIFYAGAGRMALNDGALTGVPAVAGLTFKASANPQQPGNIGTPNTVAYGLVAPKLATATNVTLSLVLGEKGTTDNDRPLTVTTALFNAQWQKGRCYTYNLLLDKNDITLKSVDIKGWNDGGGGSQDVPPVIE